MKYDHISGPLTTQWDSLTTFQSATLNQNEMGEPISAAVFNTERDYVTMCMEQPAVQNKILYTRRRCEYHF